MASSTNYPRPDFQRSALNWKSLDGAWDFTFDDQDAGKTELWQRTGLPSEADGKASHAKRQIQVPYAFQYEASGIGLYEDHEVIWYERKITDIRTADEAAKGHRLLMRFGAVDFECSVWVDGAYFGGHQGGHTPFDIDVSDAFHGPNQSKDARVTVRVRDSPHDLAQPRGKQYWKAIPEIIWYTPTSGIWLSVWLESVPKLRLGSSSEGTILRSNDVAGGQLHAHVVAIGRNAGTDCSVEIEANIGGQQVSKSGKQSLAKDATFADFAVDMKVPDVERLRTAGAPYSAEGCWSDKKVALWAPEHPLLYDLTIRLYDSSDNVVDEVNTTTGMRSLSWTGGDATFRLNGKPYFQALVLDQGYWPKTGMTPPSQDALKTDIELSMKMGFNGCRKHQKVEDPLFLYWADRLGYLVWGEIANAYLFNDDYVTRFNSEWMEAVRRDINHPCIVTWTPNNESWGYTDLENSVEQRNHIRTLYHMTKTLDPSRPINDNCGWEHVITDLTTYHDYADHEELAQNCSKMENGILGLKHETNRRMFPNSIARNGTVVDTIPGHKDGAPILCTEFGGVNIAPGSKESAGERDWGYTTATDPEDLLRRLEKLIMAVVKGGLTCGFVYTQLSDVEQEVNGLYSFNREAKISPDRVKAIMDAAQRYYHENVAPKS